MCIRLIFRWGKTHALITSIALELLDKRHVGLYILSICEIRGIALARPGRAISLYLDSIHAEILEIERVPLVATCEIGIAH